MNELGEGTEAQPFWPHVPTGQSSTETSAPSPPSDFWFVHVMVWLLPLSNKYWSLKKYLYFAAQTPTQCLLQENLTNNQQMFVERMNDRKKKKKTL